MFYKTKCKSPFGCLTLCSDGKNLTGLFIDGQKYFLNTDKMQTKDDLEIFFLTKALLDDYFKGKNPEFSKIPLFPSGSNFRQDVWKILSKIPYGKTVTYGEIAVQIARKKGILKMSAQAVGNAVGHNPISIIIPCHRVLGRNGRLTGYAGGIDKKLELLRIEGLDTSKFVP